MRIAPKLAHGLICMALGVVCVAGAGGCDLSGDGSTSSNVDIVADAASNAGVAREDVAIVVEGTVFTQDQVDEFVMQLRATNGLSDEADYQAYLEGSGLTEWDVRKSVMRQVIRSVLILKDAQAQGIAVDDDTVRSRIDQLESRYPSHEAWLRALSASGYTEESYYTSVLVDVVSRQLQDKMIPEPKLTDEQIQQYAVLVAPTLAGRRSSHILFSKDDYATATEVYQRLLDGEDFAEMAREYSIDGTGANGGDMGWDSQVALTSEYQEALDKLEPGEMSPIVKSQFGYHIILCTEKYEPTYLEDGSIDLSTIPSDLMEIIQTSMKDSLSNQMFETYVSNLEATAALAVFDEDATQVPPEEIGLATQVVPIEEDSQIDDAVENAEDAVDAIVTEPSQSDDQTVPSPSTIGSVVDDGLPAAENSGLE